MMKNLLLLIISLLLGITSYAQQENSSLHLPQELEGMGQKIHDAFEYMYSRTSEYVKVTDKVSKADMDSISRVAVMEYTEKAFAEHDSIFKNFLFGSNTGGGITNDPKFNPEQQVLIDDIKSVIMKYKPKDGLPKLAEKLGEINQKATKTLSDTDAIVVYAVSMTTYYSTKYWLNNMPKWQALGEEVKKKKK
jgi:hypothetical protein